MGKRVRAATSGGSYLLLILPLAMATMLIPPLLLVAGLSVVLAGAGFVLLPQALTWTRRWADWHRDRAAALLGVSVTPRYVPLRGDLRGRWRQVWRDPATVRDIRWLFVHIGIGIPLGLLTLVCVVGALGALVAAPLWWLLPSDFPLQLLFVPVTDWGSVLVFAALQLVVCAGVGLLALPGLARLHARACLVSLGPSDTELMAERVDELTESRAGALDAHAAELRRIERDLHDGTQARLVSIAMRLGVAREALTEDPESVATLLREAHEGAEEAMSELRDVIRTVYPPILADRGLSGALSALAARSAVPARIDAADLGRLSAAVEAAAYFAVAETLTNVVKHSRATQAVVQVRRHRGSLVVRVEDDGVGGADARRGTGLAGIRRRVAALDGTVAVHSPSGGPTAITVELPCEQ